MLFGGKTNVDRGVELRVLIYPINVEKYQIAVWLEGSPFTVWAVDFETPVGRSTFFSFLGSIGRNKQ
jgi:hypothetical protein